MVNTWQFFLCLSFLLILFPGSNRVSPWGAVPSEYILLFCQAPIRALPWRISSSPSSSDAGVYILSHFASPLPPYHVLSFLVNLLTFTQMLQLLGSALCCVGLMELSQVIWYGAASSSPHREVTPAASHCQHPENLNPEHKSIHAVCSTTFKFTAAWKKRNW